MHTLIIQKSNGLILQSRNDTATGPKMPIDEVLSTYTNDVSADPALIEIIEIPFTKFSLEIGRHIYSKSTGQIEQNSNWIEPPAPETSSIPVADPGAPQ